MDENWNIDELVEQANRAAQASSPGDADEVNVRLVRHYASIKLIDEPGKLGKEARYGARHLRQILLVRKLLSSGYGTAAIGEFARQATNEQLDQLVAGRLELTIKSNPALEYLQQIRNRQPNAKPNAAVVSDGCYHKLTLEPGLEIHVEQGFKSSTDMIRLMAKFQSAMSNLQKRGIVHHA